MYNIYIYILYLLQIQRSICHNNVGPLNLLKNTFPLTCSELAQTTVEGQRERERERESKQRKTDFDLEDKSEAG